MQITPIRLNDRQEVFAIAVANGVRPSVAYAKVYPVTGANAKVAGDKLAKVAKVASRIFQLRQYEAAAARITLPFLTKELLEVATEAKLCAQYAAAQQALMGIAKLHGFMIDRAQIEMVLRKPAATPDSPDDMSEQAWVAQYAVQPLIEGSKGSEPQVVAEK
jgi:hypothetical protein